MDKIQILIRLETEISFVLHPFSVQIIFLLPFLFLSFHVLPPVKLPNTLMMLSNFAST